MNNNIKLSDKIITIIENNGFSISEIQQQNKDYYIEINQYTPAGEDWYEIIWFDGKDKGFINALTLRAEEFNIDEEAEVWITNRGKRGVPNSISCLVADQEWKQKKLKQLSNEFIKIKGE